MTRVESTVESTVERTTKGTVARSLKLALACVSLITTAMVITAAGTQEAQASTPTFEIEEARDFESFVGTTSGVIRIRPIEAIELAVTGTSENVGIHDVRCSWSRCFVRYFVTATNPGPVEAWIQVADTAGRTTERVELSGRNLQGSVEYLEVDSDRYGVRTFRADEYSGFGVRIEDNELVVPTRRHDHGRVRINPSGDEPLSPGFYESLESNNSFQVSDGSCGVASVDIARIETDARGWVNELVLTGAAYRCNGSYSKAYFSIVLTSGGTDDLLVGTTRRDVGTLRSINEPMVSFVHNLTARSVDPRVDLVSPAVEIGYDTCNGRALVPAGSCIVVGQISGYEFGAFDVEVKATTNAHTASGNFVGVWNQTTVYQKVGSEHSAFGGDDVLFEVDDDGTITIDGYMDGYKKSFVLAPADDRPLEPGYYTNVPTVANRNSDMGFDPGSPWCQGPSTVNIREIEWRFDGSISKLDADFTSTCGLYGNFEGKIRHNAPFSRSAVQINRTLEVVPTAETHYSSNMVRVTNHGPRTTTLGSVQIKGDVNYGYRIGEQDCAGATLRPGESCQVHIQFMPYGSTANGYPGMLEIEGETMLGSLKSFFETEGHYGGNLQAKNLENRSGYWLLGDRGNVTAFGDAASFRTNGGYVRAVDIEASPTGRGFWVLRADGTIGSYGDAPSYNGESWRITSELEPDEQVSSVSSNLAGTGLWVFTDRGRVIEFGTAHDLGDLTSLDLAGSIVSASTTPTARGIYMLGSDGGVFALGDAQFAGSVPQVLPGLALDAPIVGLVPDPDGFGYWLVASDGGVFAFEAPFRGSIPQVLPPGAQLDAPIVAMVAYGNGYLLVGADGGVFNFSDLDFAGSLAGQSTNEFVSIAAVPERDGWIDAVREVKP